MTCLLALLFLLAAVPAAAGTVEFTMPLVHVYRGSTNANPADPLSDGYRKWRIGVSYQSPVCKGTPPGFCGGANFADWQQGARIVVADSGYARPGEHVVRPRPLVSSLYWPYAIWAQSFTDVPGAWTLVGEFSGP